MKSSLKNMVVVLTTVSFISSAAVGGAYIMTKDAIKNASDNKFKDAIQQVLPEFDTLKDAIEVENKSGSTTIKIYEATLDSETTGYAVETSALGFTQDIILLAGFNEEGDIYKIAVLSHAETPGLGSKIANTEDKFVVQFQGKNPETFKMVVKKDGGDVESITASTVTSKAYTLAVKNAFDAIRNFKK